MKSAAVTPLKDATSDNDDTTDNDMKFMLTELLHVQKWMEEEGRLNSEMILSRLEALEKKSERIEVIEEKCNSIDSIELKVDVLSTKIDSLGQPGSRSGGGLSGSSGLSNTTLAIRPFKLLERAIK